MKEQFLEFEAARNASLLETNKKESEIDKNSLLSLPTLFNSSIHLKHKNENVRNIMEESLAYLSNDRVPSNSRPLPSTLPISSRNLRSSSSLSSSSSSSSSTSFLQNKNDKNSNNNNNNTVDDICSSSSSSSSENENDDSDNEAESDYIKLLKSKTKLSNSNNKSQKRDRKSVV